MDLSSFHQQLPVKVKDLFNEITNEGFYLSIVGGVSRDYLLYQKIGHDFDCEVRPMASSSIDKWKDFCLKLKEKYQGEILKYNVLRIKLKQNIEVELTLPRLEHFDGSYGHSNFEAQFIADLDYSQGFLRRDFTINSIYFEYDGSEWVLKDPTQGMDDLKEKKLCPTSHAFSMDPIRFLRAFRFRVNLAFKFSEQLEEILESMPIEGINHYYFKEELEKCRRPFIMLKKIGLMRSEIFQGDHIRQENKDLIVWDKLYQGDLESHIKQGVILGQQFRSMLCHLLHFSTKNLLPSIRFSESWHSLLSYHEDTETFKAFFDTMTFLEKMTLSDNKLDYLLNYYNFSMNLEEFKKFTQISYQLNDEDMKKPNSMYKFIIFKSRLKELN